jgi:hypothetical protein
VRKIGPMVFLYLVVLQIVSKFKFLAYIRCIYTSTNVYTTRCLFGILRDLYQNEYPFFYSFYPCWLVFISCKSSKVIITWWTCTLYICMLMDKCIMCMHEKNESLNQTVYDFGWIIFISQMIFLTSKQINYSITFI